MGLGWVREFGEEREEEEGGGRVSVGPKASDEGLLKIEKRDFGRFGGVGRRRGGVGRGRGGEGRGGGGGGVEGEGGGWGVGRLDRVLRVSGWFWWVLGVFSGAREEGEEEVREVGSVLGVAERKRGEGGGGGFREGFGEGRRGEGVLGGLGV